jgi:hypothetical protein
MADASILTIVAPAAIVGLAIVSTALLRGWSGYLAVKRMEFELSKGDHSSIQTPRPSELLELKERVRKLEAIASGVDL